jgi:choline dehydrogenase-like flavoprotein
MGQVIIRGRDLARDLSIDVDAVVVGTGAGGSIALRELARAGLRTVALEEGGYLGPNDFSQREDEMIPRLFQDGGGRTTDDLAIRVLQGRGVGGSTVHNTNLCKRTPDAILEDWGRSYRVSGAAPSSMAPAFAQIEADLSVAPMLAEWENGNNLALRRGVTSLGWQGGPLKHNRVGCQQSGFCELGCSYDAKQNALKVVLPEAIRAGADVYADVQVTRVLVAGGRAVGVSGVARDETGHPKASITVRARVVVLAGSAVGSAALALASGLPDPYGQLGRGLRLHPGGVVAGRFDRAIDASQGIPQSYECTELLSFEPGSDKRVWIIPAFAHPIGTAATLPGFGAAHMKAMRSYNHLAVLTAMVHDQTSGQVTVSGEGRPVLRYAMNEGDRAQLAKGLLACARLLFAAGAVEVTIPAVFPVRLTSEAEIEKVGATLAQPHAVPLTAVHPMGTLRMGDDPKTSVVSSQGQHHQVPGLFVADGSLFPTSIGVPPQISIYAFALHLAPHFIEAARHEG